MSVPTGWLGFLAEIKAKLCHHNVTIVTEGCTLLSRLLLCDLSVRVLIDSDVLSVLLDTLIGVCSRKQGVSANNATNFVDSTVPWVDVYLATALFRSLSDIAIHSAALVTDVAPSDMSTFLSDPVSLLSQVTKTDSIHRAILAMLNTVTTVLTSWSTISAFGRILESNILGLLTELVQIERKVRKVLDQVLQGGCDDSCVAVLNRNAPAKQVYSQGVSQFFVEVPGDSSSLRHQVLQSLKAVWGGGGGGPRRDTSSSPSAATASLYVVDQSAMEKLAGSRSHQTFLENLATLDMVRMIASLCGVDTANSTLLQSTDFRQCFLRFFGNAPANRVDGYLLERVLSTLSRLLQEGVSFSILTDGFIDELLRSAGALVPMVQNVMLSLSPSSDACSSIMSSGGSDAPCVPVLSILSFLVGAEEIATSPQIGCLVKSGLFLTFVKILDPLQTSSSLLSDAPTITDGALSDEVYLSAALDHAKTARCSSGVLVLKLCTSLLSNHAIYICENYYQEVIALQSQIMPTLARILIRFPTMSVRQNESSGRPQPIRTRCCEMPIKSRTTRFSPIGECAAVCLDAVIRMKSADESHTCQTLIPFLPSIARSTARSLFPHLRGLHFRLLAQCVVNSGSLLTLVKSMPSAISAPVGTLLSFNGCDDDLISWEVSAAAEWISRVLRITVQDNHLQNFNLLETALPLKLLEITASTSKPHVKAVLLALTLGISKHQVQVSESNAAYRSRISNVVVPQTMSSLSAWEKILNSFLLQLSELTLDWGANNTANNQCLPPRTPDAPHRLVGAMQSATAKLQCANNTLRCLSAYYLAAKSSSSSSLDVTSGSSPMSQLLSHSFMQTVLTAVITCPTESIMRANMAFALGTDIMPWYPLNRAYESVIRSVCELFSQHYFPCETATTYPRWPTGLLSRVGQLIQDHSVSPATRQCLPVLLSSAIHAATPAHSDFLEGVGVSSGVLFISMLSLPRSRTATACQARLVSLFPEANQAAFESRWVTVAVENLRSTLRQFREHRQTTMSDVQKLEVEGSLTIVASAFAYSECRPSTAEHAPMLDAFAKLLYVLLSGDCGTPWVIIALKLCRSISVSPAGRDILANEVNTCPGDGSNRSCFSKLVQKTVGSNLTGRISDGPNEAVTGAARARYNTHVTNEFVVGAECISTVVHKGGTEAFAQNLVKMHIIENMTTYLQGMRRQRLKIPIVFVRLLAALSFAECVQPVLFRQLDLITILLDVASEATEKGTLALLCLRNICFHAGLKVSVCQDGRFILLFKQALLHQQSSGSSGTMLTSSSPLPSNPTDTNMASISTSPLLRQRALLALTAFTSLCHRNERAKSYVRSTLSQPPVVTSALLVHQFGLVNFLSANNAITVPPDYLAISASSNHNSEANKPPSSRTSHSFSTSSKTNDIMDVGVSSFKPSFEERLLLSSSRPATGVNSSEAHQSVMGTTLTLLEHLGAIATS